MARPYNSRPSAEAPPAPEMVDLLNEALTAPGRMGETFNRFHTYSFSNQLWLLMQGAREPVASYARWKSLGRQVLKGSSGLYVLRPITVKSKTEVDEHGKPKQYTKFKPVKGAFVYSQTEGETLPEPEPREWSKERALGHFGINLARYSSIDGNTQGRSYGKTIEINPIATEPVPTFFHELSHVVHGHTEPDQLDLYQTHRGTMEFEAEGAIYFPWEDPEAEFEFVDNVITGAALTNIPLFKKLKPIMASRLPSKKKADVTSGDGKNHNQGEPMKLEDILAKQVSERSDEEKAFLSDHAAELTDEQKTQVETEGADAEAQAKADKEAADKAAAEQAEKDKAEADAKAADEAAKVDASRKGQTTISADRLAKLEASAARADALAAEIDRNKATATVKASIKAGQVKSGDEASWTDFLVGLKASQRSGAEKLLASLPKNETLGEELGAKGQDVAVETELETRVNEAIKASEGKLKYSAALMGFR